MEIKVDSLLHEMQALRSQSQIGPDAPSKVTDDFSAMLKGALDNVNDLQQQTNDMRTRFELGDRSMSLSQVMLAGQKSSIAFEATLQVRNKFVEAYKQIMSMQV